jgi:DNA-binding GntR family transcriptional regulator
VVTIGIGRDDPRLWVKTAYAVADAMERGEIGPRDKLPLRSQVAARLGVHPTTVARAYRELTDMGIIYLVPGLGYFPSVKLWWADARRGSPPVRRAGSGR